MYKKFFLNLLVSLFILNSLVLNSQSKSYDLKSAIEYSLDHNREIKIAKLEINKANAAVSEAYGYAYPSLDFTASFSHFLEKAKMPFPDFESMLNNATYGVLFQEQLIKYDQSKLLPMETKLQSFALSNNYEASLQLTQILFNSAVLQGIGSAGTYLKTSKVMFKSQLSKTILNTQKAFYTALLMKDMLGVIKGGYNTFDETVKRVEKLYSQGLVSEFDYLQLKVQLENFRPRVIEAENGYQLTLDALKLAMSLDKSENIDVIGNYDLNDINIPDLDQSIIDGINNNLDIQSLEYKKKVDEAFVELSRSEYYPTLVAFGNMTFQGAADDFKFMNYRTSLVGLSLQINLFNGLRTNSKVEQQLIGVQKTEEQLYSAKDGIAIAIKSKILDMQRIKESINYTNENVELAERAYNLAELRLREGTGTQLEIINAEQAKREAVLNKYKLMTDYFKLKFDLDNLLGIINQEYLQKFRNEIN